MNRDDLAQRLDGREYRNEMSNDDERLAKQHGLLVVFGCSDDNMEFRGAFSDEVGCYNGGTCSVDAKGVIPEWERFIDGSPTEEDAAEYLERKKHSKWIEAVWTDGSYAWIYKTDAPHSTFDIVEDGELYCRGIVIDVKDLG